VTTRVLVHVANRFALPELAGYLSERGLAAEELDSRTIAVTVAEGVDETRARRDLIVMLSSWNASHPDAFAALED
jgi:hypothetical protein